MRQEEKLLDSLIVLSPKEQTIVTQENIDLELRKLKLEVGREQLTGNIQDRTERKNYANKVYWFILGFLAVVMFIVAASGWKFANFNLSDKVLIALLTTTSANVIAIFMVVMRYLFRQSYKETSSN